MTRLLLDTHIAIWLEVSPEKIAPDARAAIETANDVVISVIVPWEITLLRGRKRVAPGLPLIGIEAPSRHGPLLPVTAEHVAALAALPWHHRDPFDRMLVAQALADGMVIVSADRAIRAYDVPVLPA
jgi:PIN domain nuclease of toxin-antitoxin system